MLLTRNYPQAEKYFDIVKAAELPEYAVAKKNLLEFKKKTKNIGSKEIKLLLDKDIAGCDSGIFYTNFPEEIKVENAGKSVNNPHAEFSPLFMDDNSILFGSLRMDSIQYFDITEQNSQKQPIRKIFKADYKDNFWVENGLADQFKDIDTDIGDITYSPYTERFYYSKCKKSPNSTPTCKLYYSDKSKKQFLFHSPINTDGFNSTQPAIAYDSATNSETLYYVTNRTGGKGGLDIWYSTFNITKNKWTGPSNLSATNTPGTEFSPFYHQPTKTLYFSSNGHASAGGLDVFKINKVADRFSTPKNVGFPINTAQDDFDYCLNKNGNKGFVVSNRPGGTPYFHLTCCDDIFAFEPLPYKPFNKSITFSVNSENPTDLDSAKMIVLKTNVKKNTRTKEAIDLNTKELILPLEKNTSYVFYLLKPGFKSDTVSIDYKETNNEDLALIKSLTLSKIPNVIALSTNSLITTTKVTESLSNKVGETKPSKALVDSTITSNVVKKSEKAISNTIETESNQKVKNSHKNKHKEVELSVVPTIEKPFTISDIQYEIGSSELSDEAKAAIDSLLIPFLAKNIAKKILISSHTDHVGSHHFNMQLSKDRVSKVAEYLISKDIKASRLVTKGFGETKPIAPNENPDGSDDPIGRGLNRRTEFQVLK